MTRMGVDSKNGGKAERDSSDKPSIDELFDILSDSRRRQILSILMDHGEELTLSQLADKVASRDSGPPRNEVPKEKHQVRSEVPEDSSNRLTTSLHHVDIPKMDQVGLVEFDPDRKTIRATENATQIEQILALSRFPFEPGNRR